MQVVRTNKSLHRAHTELGAECTDAGHRNETGAKQSRAGITQHTIYDKMLSYRRETALQGGLVMANSGRLELGDNIYGHYRSICNHCAVKKTQNKGYYAVQGHRGQYQSKARRRLPISF